MAFAAPVPSDLALHEYYEHDYRGTAPGPLFDGLNHWDASSARARAQVEFVCRYHGARDSWLDIGAGYGALLAEAQRSGAHKTGAIEPDAQCQIGLRQAGHKLYRQLAEVTDTWNVVSLSHVLEHLPSPRIFLSRIRDVLSHDGYVFCEVPNEWNLSAAQSDLPHLLFFSAGSLTRLFESSGFTVVALYGCGQSSQGSVRERCRVLVRRATRRLFSRPPRWMDHYIFPHFDYPLAAEHCSWLRLIARRTL